MADNQKRKLDETDPDYENVDGEQTKRQRVLEEDGRQNACNKVQAIICKEFQAEISQKESELQQVDIRLNQARLMLDRLRACIVANYYGLAGQSVQVSKNSQGTSKSEVQSIHPAVKKFIGKAPRNSSVASTEDAPQKDHVSESVVEDVKEKEILRQEEETVRENVRKGKFISSLLPKTSSTHTSRSNSPYLGLNPSFDDRRARLKIKRKIIVGNISKYIPVDQREANDMSSHKWMVYVRGPKSDPDISYFVRKVWFFLHHSYKPNDLVEISNPPFHLTRRGWGEFPVRVQLHFVDPRNKKVDIFHHLKLDKTFTGLQKLGGETVVEVELEREFYGDSQGGHDNPETLSVKAGPSLLTSSSSCSSLSSHKEQQLSKASKSSTSIHSEVKELTSLAEKSKSSELIPSLKINQEVISLPVSDREDNIMLNGNVTSTKSSSGKKQQLTPAKKFQVNGEASLVEDNISSSDCVDQDSASLPCLAKFSVSNSNSDNEYNVTIAHTTHHHHLALDQEVDVCDDGKAFNDKDSAPHHLSSTNANAKVLGPSENVKPSKGPGNVEHISSQGDLLKTLPSSSGHLKEVSGLRMKPTVICVSGSSSSASFQSPTAIPLQVQVLNKVNRNVQAEVSERTAHVIDPAKILPSPSASLLLKSPNNQPAKVVHDFPHMKKASALQVVQPTSSPQSLIRKDGLRMQNRTTLSATPPGAVSLLSPSMMTCSSKRPPFQNEDPKKTSLLMEVKTQQPTPKFLVVNSHVINTVSQQPTVKNSVPPAMSQSGKKQVSLLTGLVINSSKSIHSSNARSLLKPGTSNVVNALNNQSVVAKTGVQPAKTQLTVKAAGKQHFTSLLPMTGHRKITVGHKEILVPMAATTGGVSLMTEASSLLNHQPVLCVKKETPLLNQNSKSNVGISVVKDESCFSNLLQQISIVNPTNSHGIYRGVRDVTSSNVPRLPDQDSPVTPKMSAIGITKHRHLMQMYKQVAGSKGKKGSNDLIEGTVDRISSLSKEMLDDCQNVHDLMKATIKLHPLIRGNVNKLTHPYCACSQEQWASWPVGKQRASEWHRACFALKYVKFCLQGNAFFKGEKLMSTRQLVEWCRLHAFSPQPPIFNKMVHEQASSSQENMEDGQIILPAQAMITSVTKLKDVEGVLQKEEKSAEESERNKDSDFVIDIVGEEINTAPLSVKQEKFASVGNQASTESSLLLHRSDGALFVDEWMRQRGIKFPPYELDTGVMTHTPADMIFSAMNDFASDILRKAVCVNAEQNSNPGNITLKDVHRGLTIVPEASFCCNRYLGKEDVEESNEDTPGREKEIYR